MVCKYSVRSGARMACYALVLGGTALLAPAPAMAKGSGAPVVFANRDAPRAVERPAPASRATNSRPASAPAASEAGSGGADLLYSYGPRRTRTQPVIDLRAQAGAGPQVASLDDASSDAGLEEYTAETEAAPARAPTEFRAPPAPRPAVPVARAIPASATAAAPPPSRPEWLEQERTGAPYEAHGQWYVPTAEPNYNETGTASWYGDEFRGRRTASGEVFDPDALSAAHPTLPIPSLVQVTNLANGREVIVRVNDRGPFHANRLIDVSRKTAEVLGFAERGHAQVSLRYLGPAPKRVATGAAESGANGAEEPAVIRPEPVAPPAPSARAARGAFLVQAGAFSDPSNAARAKERLSALGDVVVDVRSGGALHRVRVGAWESRAAADAARQEAVRLGFAGAVIAMAD